MQREGARIVSMLLKTNHGQQHDIIDWRPFTDEEPPALEVSVRILRPERGHEIVGFCYVTGVSLLLLACRATGRICRCG